MGKFDKSKSKDPSKNPLNFSVSFQNIEGLHVDGECFLADITQNINSDINFLAETWTCEHDKEIKGFNSFHKNGYKTPGVCSGRSSGGLLVYIKEHLYKHVKILKSTPYNCWVEVDKKVFNNLNENLIISAQYCPPTNSKYSTQNSLEELDVDILKFCNENTPFILVGDLNARSGCLPDNLEIDPNLDPSGLSPSEFLPRNNRDEIITTQGQKLIDLLIGKNLRILNGRMPGDSLGNFTTFKNDHLTVNDYGIVSDCLFADIDDFRVFPQNVFSDHSKIVVTLKSTISIADSKNQKDLGWYDIEKRKIWDKTSLSLLKENLENISDTDLETLTDLINRDNTKEASSEFFKIINKSILAAPKASRDLQNTQTKFRHKKRKKKNKSWFDKELQDIKRETNYLANLKHSDPENFELKNLHTESLKLYKEKCRVKRTSFRQDSFDKMNKMINNSEELWKNFKSFSENRKPKNQVTDKISAEDWLNHFKNLHTEFRNQTIPVIVENKPTDSLNKPIDMEELQNVIKKMKNKKAEGVDKIANDMIKYFPEKILKVVLCLFNKFLKSGEILNEWCEGLITPLYKENEKNNPDNYRGICISNALLKCLCLILNNRLKLFCHENELIASEQIGFREKSRTSDHIFTLKHLVTNHLNAKKGNKVFACFIDLRKAYDSINHKALFHKLRKYNINGNFLSLIQNLYQKTKCAVKVNGRRTDFFQYSKGVRQGCPLSPLLFNLFINGIVKCLNKNNPKPLKLNQNISCLLYADDLVIFSSSKEGLQKSLDAAANYFSKWNLDINYDKTKCMIFNKRGDKGKHEFNIKGNIIKNVKVYKYLGIHISSKNCSLKNSLNELAKKANRALFSLKSNLNLMKMPVGLVLKLFDTMIVPILLYGAEVWVATGKYLPEKWDKLAIEKEHTQLLKQILGLNRSVQNIVVRADFGRTPLLVEAHGRVWGYIRYLRGKTDTLVKNAYLADSVLDEGSSVYKLFETGIKELITQNIKKHQDPYLSANKKVKMILKNDYIENFWKIKIRESSRASAYASHKLKYEQETYLDCITIKKHRVSLAKLRMSDHQLNIQKGRHTRPTTPRHLRFCEFCKDELEDEAHFMFECQNDNELKSLLVEKIISKFPDFAEITNRHLKYKFLMNLKDPDLLKSLGYIVNTLFMNLK